LNVMSSEFQKSKALKVLIRSKNKTFFDGVCYSVSSMNDVGEFDILSEHANFVTLIKNKIIIDKSMDSEKTISIDNKAVLNIINNQVDVYLGV